MAGGEAVKKSDLGVRTLTAIAMIVVAGGALWLGGWFWALFVGLVAMGVLWEWRALVRGFAQTAVRAAIWNVAGFLYIAVAALTLLWARSEIVGDLVLLLIVGAVVATDIGAYFAGRAIGGPKIAPRISPSKTWAGLFGGMLGAALLLSAIAYSNGLEISSYFPQIALTGAAAAVIAQAGDFFESWMKRRAGVKDSGKLLPGHGGLFDRVDGLLAVLFVLGVAGVVTQLLPHEPSDVQLVLVSPQ